MICYSSKLLNKSLINISHINNAKMINYESHEPHNAKVLIFIINFFR